MLRPREKETTGWAGLVARFIARGVLGTVTCIGAALLTGWLWFRLVPLPPSKGFGILGAGGGLMIAGLIVSLAVGVVSGLGVTALSVSRWLGRNRS